jgi:hypothetical protein
MTTKRCIQCDNIVIEQEVEMYKNKFPFYCSHCDENLISDEVYS